MRRLAATLWLWAAIIRPLKHVLPLATLVHLVGGGAARDTADDELVERLDRLSRNRERFPLRAPANCLERALGAYRLLGRAGMRPELIVGIRRGTNGRLDGHTWVVVGGRALGEDHAFLAGFTPLIAFDADGRQVTGPSRLPRGTRVA